METLDEHNGFSGPTFNLKNRLKRLLWNITWMILASWTPPFMHGWRRLIVVAFGGKIHPTAHIYGSATIWAPWNLVVEKNGGLGPKVNAYSIAPITIGENVVVSQGAQLCTGTHDFNDKNFRLVARPITIENHAWICAGAFIGPGVSVGEGAIIGAMGVTFKSLEPWTIYQGNPAQQIKKRQNLKQSS